MDNSLEQARKLMVERQLVARGIEQPEVLRAFREVPRHEFLSSSHRQDAYRDGPLPIGRRQTMSQPYMVAIMTESANIDADDTVLEIGTGSGYQAAILAEMGAEVYTVERWDELSKQAEATIRGLGYTRVHFKVSDGTAGWPEKAPYDAIIVTAGAPKVPEPLVEQLNLNGRLVIPVEEGFSQVLYSLIKTEEGIEKVRGERCTFVPLIGEHGWEE